MQIKREAREQKPWSQVNASQKRNYENLVGEEPSGRRAMERTFLGAPLHSWRHSGLERAINEGSKERSVSFCQVQRADHITRGGEIEKPSMRKPAKARPCLGGNLTEGPKSPTETKIGWKGEVGNTSMSSYQGMGLVGQSGWAELIKHGW